MSHRRILLVALLVWTAACGTTGSMPRVQPGQPSSGIPQADWAEIFLPLYDRMATAAGLSSLRHAAPARTEHEARIWIHGPGDDVELYRFVDERGNVSGELLLAWEAGPVAPPVEGYPGVTWHDLAVFRARGPCSEFFVSSGVGGCRSMFRTPPDWRGTLRRLEAVGLWELPDESNLQSREIVFDGFGITVELLSAAGYRTYHYGNPDMQRWPEDRRAAELMRIVDEVSDSLPSRESIREYRGQVGGPGWSEFRPCGSQEVWQVDQHAVRSAAARLGVTLPVVAASDTAPSLYVDVTGEVPPTWLARWWGSSREQVLSVLSASVVRPWRDGGC